MHVVFFRILKLFFITGFLLQYLGNWYRTNGPLVNFTIFNTSNKYKAGDINSPWNLLVYLFIYLYHFIYLYIYIILFILFIYVFILFFDKELWCHNCQDKQNSIQAFCRCSREGLDVCRCANLAWAFRVRVKRTDDQVVSPPDFVSQGPGLESRWGRNSGLYCSNGVSLLRAC